MLPFTPRGGSTPQSQQAPGAQSNTFPNLMQMQPQMGFTNPQLSNPFNHNNNNSNNSNMGNGVRPQGFMNMPNFNAFQQNPLLGSIQALQQQFQSQPGFSPQNFGQNTGFMVNGQLGNMGQNMIPGNSNPSLGLNSGFMGNGQLGNMGQSMIPGNTNPGMCQFGGWNQGQNPNQMGGMVLNPAQVAALTQLMGCVNQVAQGMIPQNATFLGNPQLGVVQPNGALPQPGNFGQQLPMASQQLQNVPAMPFNPAMVRPQINQSQNLQNQGNQGPKQGMQISNARHNQNKNFTKNPRREASNWRSPKSKPQQMNNGGKGVESADPENSTKQTESGKRRPLFLLYSEKEIQKWREERKKNYPTKDNFHKKLSQKQANADAAAEDAKLRRQQLQEVLAKQIELGLEVPEIPSHYMLDDEDLSHGKGQNKRSFNNGRHQNKFNKRGRFDKTNRFPSKRRLEGSDLCGENEHCTTKPKEENKNDNKTPIREPTLLKKLLSADMKRDNSRLLQAFRFMVMNSFFIEKTDEPLNFPKVIVEEKGDGVDEELSLKELNDTVEVNGVCQEEGEITD